MTSDPMTDVRLVEIHGDQSSPRTFAKHFVEKQGYTVINVKPSGQRCQHGSIVWAVTVKYEED